MSVFKKVVEDLQAKESEAKAAAEAAAERAKAEKQALVRRVRDRFTEAGVYSFMREQSEQMTQLGYWNQYHENTVDDRAIASLDFVPKAGEQPKDSHPTKNVNVCEMVVSCMGDTVECFAGTRRERVPLNELNAELVAKWFEAFARESLETRNEADKVNDASDAYPSTRMRSRL